MPNSWLKPGQENQPNNEEAGLKTQTDGCSFGMSAHIVAGVILPTYYNEHRQVRDSEGGHSEYVSRQEVVYEFTWFLYLYSLFLREL